MAQDVPDGALSAEAVLEWLPDRRLSIDYIPALVDQDVDRIEIDIGTVTRDVGDMWLTILYVSDVEAGVMQVVGWDPDADQWASVETLTTLEYDPDDIRARVAEWLENRYPDSTFSETN